TSQVIETYTQPTGTLGYTGEVYESQKLIYETQKPIYDYQGAEQRPSQYSYSLQGIQQQQPAQPEGVTYVPEVTRGYFAGRSEVQEIPQKQIIHHVPVAPTALSYYEQQPASVSTSQVIETYTQPTGTLGYTGEVYESQKLIYETQKPIYDYQGA
ncbi:unnamed protein product, partial [Rotaria sp. Silwood2]